MSDFPARELGTQYKELINSSKKDGLLYIKSTYRLGRRYEEILQQRRALAKEIGAGIVLQVLQFVAENEHIKKRQAEGIAAAKIKGVRLGRAPIPLPDNFYEIHLARKRQTLAVCL